MTMAKHKRCPACYEGDVNVFFELEGLPVHCNLLWPAREAAVQAPRGDIRLGFCRTCGMIYNFAFDPGRMEYSQSYENSLHFSPRFQAYAEELAAQLIEKYQLYHKNIIEIGCGKGEFLSLLCRAGKNHGVGFDPSYDGNREENGKLTDITFIPDFYSGTYAEKYAADFICCRQVLEHIQHPRDFLLRLRQAIRERRETGVFFEVPDVMYTLRDFGIWDILYEHCSYFSIPALRRLFGETGFAVRQVYQTFGDQFLCVEAFPAVAPALPTLDTAAEDLEQLSNLVSSFWRNYQYKVETWEGNLRRLCERGKRVVVWGGGTKGVIFLNTVKNDEQIRYVIDINPHKQGMYIAGTGQEIVPPEFLHKYQPDMVLIMNPIYKAEIRSMLEQVGVNAEIVAV